MTSLSRQESLNAVRPGDVIFGVGAGGQEKLMLVYAATPSSISARHVTTQIKIEFSRDGRSTWCEGGGSCTIHSVAQLPREQLDAALGLDRKMRSGRQLTDLKLSKAEVELLLIHSDFFKARPLPER